MGLSATASWGPKANKILILAEILGCQSDQIAAASWSGNSDNQLSLNLSPNIRILFGVRRHLHHGKSLPLLVLNPHGRHQTQKHGQEAMKNRFAKLNHS